MTVNIALFSLQTSCLIQAICHSKYYTAVALQRHGADANVAGSNGMTPLMYATSLVSNTSFVLVNQNAK